MNKFVRSKIPACILVEYSHFREFFLIFVNLFTLFFLTSFSYSQSLNFSLYKKIELPDMCTQVGFSPHGDFFAVAAGDRYLYIYDENLKKIINITGTFFPKFSFSSDGHLLAIKQNDNTFGLFDISSKSTIQMFYAPLGEITLKDFVFSPDDKFLAVSGQCGIIKIYSLKKKGNYKSFTSLSGHSDWVNGISFSPDGTYFVSVSDDNTARIYEIRDNNFYFHKKLVDHTSRVNGLAFSKNGKFLVTASDDNSIKIYSVKDDFSLIKTIEFQDKATGVSFSADNKYLAVILWDSGIKIYRVVDNDFFYETTLSLGNFNWIYSIDFSPDGRWFAVASSKHASYIYRLSENVNGQPQPTDNNCPQITITYPPVNRGFPLIVQNKTVQIQGTATDPNGVSYVLVNNVLATLNGDNFTASVQLQQGENQITVSAADKLGNICSEKFTLKYKEQQPPPYEIQTGKYYALLIGISNYDDPRIADLNGQPTRDVDRLANVLRTYYKFERVEVLKNATYSQIIRTLDDLKRQVGPNSNLLIYYAGHGYYLPDERTGYWLPKDASRDYTDKWIYNNVLVTKLNAMQAKHILLISDACFSGSIFASEQVEYNRAISSQLIKNKLQYACRRAITSGANETVPNQSRFTQDLIEILTNNKEHYLPSSQLFSRIEIKMYQANTTPQYGRLPGDQGGDFIFVHK